MPLHPWTHQTRMSWTVGYEIAVGVQRDVGQVRIQRLNCWALAFPSDIFDDAFDVREREELLTEEQRRALLAFAKQFGSLRLHPLGAETTLLPTEALSAPTLLIHSGFGLLSPEKARALLDALTSIAVQLEDR